MTAPRDAASDRPAPGRRAFLTGRAAADAAADALADAAAGVGGSHGLPPAAGATVRVAQRSMACEFACALNPGDRSHVMHAGDALAVVHEREGVLSSYRPDSAVSRLNAAGAADGLDEGLFALLERAKRLAGLTGGAFTPLAGPLVRLWRDARAAGVLPTDEQAAAVAARCGAGNLMLDAATRSAALAVGSAVDLGGIGKGDALDRAAAHLTGQGVGSFLLHGGRSSVLARGGHVGAAGDLGGWPVGLGDPHRTTRRLGTVLLRDCAMGTSGSNVQFYRLGGRRVGHVLDPRTGLPVDPDRPGGLLCATAFAPLAAGLTAADADALSTALYVLGTGDAFGTGGAAALLDANPGMGAILVPAPAGPRLRVLVRGLDPADLFLDPAVADLGEF